MSRFSSPTAVGGFTLLEVMVAMTIVGLGVVTLLQIFSLGLRLQSRSHARNEAVAQGVRVMDELLARKRLESSADGRIGRDVRWKSETRTVGDDRTSLGLSGNWDLKELSLELRVGEGAPGQGVELKTFRLVQKGNP